MTELPLAARVLERNGYVTVVQDGSDLWHVTLTEPGRVLAAQLAAK
jgi:DNA-binding MarR family transcriptional regulator